MVCPCCSSDRCCCQEDGTIIEIDAGDECDGTVVNKPAETCNWDDVEVTFTVNGITVSASAGDFSAGNEPDLFGFGSGTLTQNPSTYIDVGGYLNCYCNFRVIDFVVNYSQKCYYTLKISECNDLIELTRIPDFFGTPDPCDDPTISVSVNWGAP